MYVNTKNILQFKQKLFKLQIILVIILVNHVIIMFVLNVLKDLSQKIINVYGLKIIVIYLVLIVNTENVYNVVKNSNQKMDNVYGQENNLLIKII